MTLRGRETLDRLVGGVRRRARGRPVAAVALIALAAGSVGVASAYAVMTQDSPSSAGSSAGAAADSGAGSGAGPVDTHGFPTGANQPGIFTDRCAYSHEAPDDAILAFGRPGISMHHDFYGNTGTTASSTAASLVGGQTTCTTGADASAYWTPVLYQNGHELQPGPALIYWRRPAHDSGAVSTVPTGLQLIAGNEGATAPQGTDIIAWSCTGVRGAARTATPHDCPAGRDLRVTVTFPSCWDGHTLIGARQVNVVYRTGTACPASHPKQIPQIVFHVAWPTSSASGLTLSMSPTMQGSTDTMHVDFMNGWTQSIVDRDVAACVATSTRCGPVTGPGAVPSGPARTTRRTGMTAKSR